MEFQKGDFNFLMGVSDTSLHNNMPHTHGMKQMEDQENASHSKAYCIYPLS